MALAIFASATNVFATTTAEYDEQISEIKAQQEANEAEAAELNATLDALRAKTADAEEYQATLEKKIENYQQSIDLAREHIDELNGKKKDSNGPSWRKFVPFLKSGKHKKEEADDTPKLLVVSDKLNRKKPIFITDDNITQYKFMHCCHPIPGDDVLGFIDNKKQIEIHKRACPVAARLKSSFGNRILDAKWDMHKKLFFDATIQMKGIDRIGLLNEVTNVISRQMNVNIHTVSITCDDDIFDGKFELRVHDREDVKTIIDNLKQVSGLQEVSQIM